MIVKGKTTLKLARAVQRRAIHQIYVGIIKLISQKIYILVTFKFLNAIFEPMTEENKENVISTKPKPDVTPKAKIQITKESDDSCTPHRKELSKQLKFGLNLLRFINPISFCLVNFLKFSCDEN